MYLQSFVCTCILTIFSINLHLNDCNTRTSNISGKCHGSTCIQAFQDRLPDEIVLDINYIIYLHALEKQQLISFK